MEIDKSWMTTFIYEQDLRSYYMNNILYSLLHTGVYNADISISSNNGILFLNIKKGTTLVFSNDYVDINSYGKITLANSDGNVDGVLQLPHQGTTVYPKTIAVTSDIPDKNTLVTTNTSQTITGYKTFSDGLSSAHASIGEILDNIKIKDGDYDNYINITSDGTIKISNDSGIIDGVLNLPHAGTTSSPKTIALTSENTFQTTAPTEAITDGGIHIVYLSSEPATKYDGYIYLIAE